MGRVDFTVNCHRRNKAGCWFAPAFTYPFLPIGLCVNWFDSMDSRIIASLLIHELAHHYCTFVTGARIVRIAVWRLARYRKLQAMFVVVSHRCSLVPWRARICCPVPRRTVPGEVKGVFCRATIAFLSVAIVVACIQKRYERDIGITAAIDSEIWKSS